MPEFHRFHLSRWTFIFEHISSQMVYSSCICWRFLPQQLNIEDTYLWWGRHFQPFLPAALSCRVLTHPPASLHSELPSGKLLRVQQWIASCWFNRRRREVTQSSTPPSPQDIFLITAMNFLVANKKSKWTSIEIFCFHHSFRQAGKFTSSPSSSYVSVPNCLIRGIEKNMEFKQRLFFF